MGRNSSRLLGGPFDVFLLFALFVPASHRCAVIYQHGIIHKKIHVYDHLLHASASFSFWLFSSGMESWDFIVDAVKYEALVSIEISG